jgi:uncharacterized protein
MLSIYVKETPGKGRGVFAQKKFEIGEVIETCPVIVLPSEEVEIVDRTQLYNYNFIWGADSKEAAIALGYGSLYNHSYTPNAKYQKDYDNKLINYICIREIQLNEEITINYNFDPEDKAPVIFRSSRKLLELNNLNRKIP